MRADTDKLEYLLISIKYVAMKVGLDWTILQMSRYLSITATIFVGYELSNLLSFYKRFWKIKGETKIYSKF